MTTSHGRHLRGFSSIGDSPPDGVSAQTSVITLSGWSGEIRGEIAVKLSLAALPPRTRPDFETSRALCGLAQNSAHSELTPNFAAQAAANLLLPTKSSGQSAFNSNRNDPNQSETYRSLLRNRQQTLLKLK
ncbi:hypothetical protein ACFQHW_04350 [Lapidilactobacillus achengensis]|uniref:Uncharacterized protein n=1 Tax=Lapidilactobacillus achengensis TaxID=2486000 RepID=A0ABW1UN88_9LACO|nr:hypothetical protein [Lapidilactobacillus achengensis]